MHDQSNDQAITMQYRASTFAAGIACASALIFGGAWVSTSSVKNTQAEGEYAGSVASKALGWNVSAGQSTTLVSGSGFLVSVRSEANGVINDPPSIVDETGALILPGISTLTSSGGTRYQSGFAYVNVRYENGIVVQSGNQSSSHGTVIVRPD